MLYSIPHTLSSRMPPRMLKSIENSRWGVILTEPSKSTKSQIGKTTQNPLVRTPGCRLTSLAKGNRETIKTQKNIIFYFDVTSRIFGAESRIKCWDVQFAPKKDFVKAQDQQTKTQLAGSTSSGGLLWYHSNPPSPHL